MTTNSPNPVDGDVQALIADCQAEIAQIEKALTTWGDAWIPSLQSKLKRQQVALAALTAEHVYQFIANNPDKDGYIEWADCNPDYFSKEPTDMRRILYTAPPAQLLRPVGLPQAFAYTIEGMEEYVDGWWLRKDDVIEALRQQGYEVKND